MLEQKPVSTSSTDEVDLVFVLVRVVGFFARTWKLFALATILGVGIGLSIFYTSPKIYRSKFTGEAMVLPDSRVVDLIHDLKKLSEENDEIQLAKKLGISQEAASKIESIEALSTIKINKEAIGVDEYLLPSTTSYIFSVEVDVKDNNILPSLQQGIVQYISSNEYSKKRAERFINNKKELIGIINRQIRKLDSVNSLYESKLITKDGPNITLAHPGDFRMLLIQLEERKQQLADEIAYSEPVRIIQPFIPFKKHVAPKRLGLIIQYVVILNLLALAGFFIQYIASVYKRNTP